MIEVLHEMLRHYGIKEIPGSSNNPEIVEMFKDIGFDWVKDDETAWCSASLNYFCKKLGYERSGRLDARSWLKLPVVVLKPELGNIVILSRGDPKGWEGHVGLFIRQDGNIVYVLGGNQSNSINISPYLASRVLGYREAKKL